MNQGSTCKTRATLGIGIRRKQGSKQKNQKFNGHLRGLLE